MARENLRDIFEEIRTIDDLAGFEDWEAEDYGIEADNGYPFYAEVSRGYLLSIAHIDGDWSAAIYGCSYGDCRCFTYADSKEDALAAILKAAQHITI